MSLNLYGQILESFACVSAPGGCDIADGLRLAAELTLLLLGITIGLAVLMIVWGGMKMILARGAEKGVSAGRNIVISALVGVAIALSAWLLVRTVANVLAPGYELPTSINVRSQLREIKNYSTEPLSAVCDSTQNPNLISLGLPQCQGNMRPDSNVKPPEGAKTVDGCYCWFDAREAAGELQKNYCKECNPIALQQIIYGEDTPAAGEKTIEGGAWSLTLEKNYQNAAVRVSNGTVPSERVRASFEATNGDAREMVNPTLMFRFPSDTLGLVSGGMSPTPDATSAGVVTWRSVPTARGTFAFRATFYGKANGAADVEGILEWKDAAGKAYRFSTPLAHVVVGDMAGGGGAAGDSPIIPRAQ